MSYEHVKTGLLIGLVGLSIVLTWQLWTFQPDINFLGETEESERASLISEELRLSEVIQPEQLITFIDGETAMISRGQEEFQQFYDILLGAELAEGDMLATGPFPKQQVRAGVEVIFPTPIPTDIFLAMFNVDRDEFNVPIAEVDRLFVYQDTSEEEIGMQMLSVEEARVIEVETTVEFEAFEQLVRGEYTPVTSVHRGVSSSQLYQHLYVPTEPTEVEKVTYTTSPLNVNFFIDELFNEPNSVRANFADSSESYTDGNRIIQLRNDGEFMDYNNPLFSENQDRSSSHIVQSSFDFINSHGGWSDPYLLANWTSADVREEAEYLLHIDGVPVISYEGQSMMRLKVSRVGSQIINYERPLFDLDSLPINAIQRVELPSGEDVLQRLRQQEYFQTKMLEKVMIGYEMKKQNVSLVTLEPYWYVLYDGKWQKVTFDQELHGEGVQ
ncbi:YycH family regulatory protein [Bacillus sp. FJAT-45037]|uniref:YycH family regulatory protein n=1 Tax=Bacillus sp. FJAT-45037 TaxID=2011007 RepID=UPI000C24CB74|nr:two-component system activity regulator YycH [Bacillus sp. FJAT-45037]